jgi:hypothetical protein
MQTPVPPENPGQRPQLIPTTAYLYPHHVAWLQQQVGADFRLNKSELIRRALDHWMTEHPFQPQG